MTSITIARNAVYDVVKDAWDASGVTSSILLLYDNKKGDPPGDDVTLPSKPLPYARATVRHLDSAIEGKGASTSKFLTEGLLTVQVFTAFGDGNDLSDSIMEVLQAALREARVAGAKLWFFNVRTPERGQERVWYRVDLLAGFRYEERT